MSAFVALHHSKVKPIHRYLHNRELYEYVINIASVIGVGDYNLLCGECGFESLQIKQTKTVDR